jgi:hypothetical protein
MEERLTGAGEAARPKMQKFFASFLQKRRSFFFFCKMY